MSHRQLHDFAATPEKSMKGSLRNALTKPKQPVAPPKSGRFMENLKKLGKK